MIKMKKVMFVMLLTMLGMVITSNAQQLNKVVNEPTVDTYIIHDIDLFAQNYNMYLDDTYFNKQVKTLDTITNDKFIILISGISFTYAVIAPFNPMSQIYLLLILIINYI